MRERARWGHSTTGTARRAVSRRPRGSEPLLLAELIKERMASNGWVIPGLAVLRAHWATIMGPDLGRHLVPEHFDERSGILHLVADSQAWATQVQFLERQMLLRLQHELAGVAPRALRITLGKPSGAVLPAASARPQVPVAGVPDPLADDWLPAEEDFPEFPEAAFVHAEAGDRVDAPDHDEFVRAQLRERLNRQDAAEARQRREREDLLRLPRGWLEGPANLNPQPVPELSRVRWAAAVVAAARLRTAGSRAPGGAE
ncbi:DUF721 domain-containing protein [Kitasatospora sp. NPDC001660]